MVRRKRCSSMSSTSPAGVTRARATRTGSIHVARPSATSSCSATGHGVVIERDDTQGGLNGFKVIFESVLQDADAPVQKTLAVDLMKLSEPLQISTPGEPG